MKKMCFKRFISGFLSLGVFLSSLTCTNTNNAEAAEPYEIAYFPGSIVHISQGANGQYSHKNTNAYDCCKNNNYVAPFSGTIVSINRDYNAVILQSDNPVYYADGSCDYMSVFLAHDNNISDLYVGKHLNQGDVFYQPGVKSPYKPEKVQPVDMFCHSVHIETVVLLSRI